MRCYFEGKVKTSADSISVDFIEIVKCSNGKIIVLDCQQHSFLSKMKQPKILFLRNCNLMMMVFCVILI